MDKIKIKVDIKSIERALKAEQIKIAEAGADGLLKAGEQIVTDTKSITPVDTGRLRASYHAQMAEKTKDESKVEVETDVEYAPYVEFGTSMQRPQPHLTPAVTSNAPKVKDFVARAIADKLK